jgi:hypothetical protein
MFQVSSNTLFFGKRCNDCVGWNCTTFQSTIPTAENVPVAFDNALRCRCCHGAFSFWKGQIEFYPSFVIGAEEVPTTSGIFSLLRMRNQVNIHFSHINISFEFIYRKVPTCKQKNDVFTRVLTIDSRTCFKGEKRIHECETLEATLRLRSTDTQHELHTPQPIQRKIQTSVDGSKTKSSR